MKRMKLKNKLITNSNLSFMADGIKPYVKFFANGVRGKLKKEKTNFSF
jgi:hypothetical protein